MNKTKVLLGAKLINDKEKPTRGTCSYLMKAYFKDARIELSTTKEGEPCITLISDIQSEKPRRRVICWLAANSDIYYQKHADGVQSYHPTTDDILGIALEPFLTPAAERMLQDFIDGCAKLLQDWIDSDTADYEVIINPKTI